MSQGQINLLLPVVRSAQLIVWVRRMSWGWRQRHGTQETQASLALPEWLDPLEGRQKGRGQDEFVDYALWSDSSLLPLPPITCYKWRRNPCFEYRGCYRTWRVAKLKPIPTS